MSEHEHPHQEDPTDDLPDMSPPEEQSRKSFADILSESPDPGQVGLITLLGIPKEELEQLVVERAQQSGRLGYLTSVRTLGSWDNITYFAALRTSGEIEREAEFLKSLEDGKFAYALMNAETGKPILSAGAIRDTAPTASKELTGREGKLRLQSAAKDGRRRIPLYCSGFTIDIRKPTPREISDLITRSRYLSGQYESQLGAPYFLFHDRLLKTEFVSLIMGLVVYSTCPQWDQEGVLLSRIDYADYPAIMAHVAAIMYPKGYDGFRHFCRRPIDAEHPKGCNHVEELTINILHMIRTRFGVFTPFQIAHMQKAAIPKTPITVDEIEAYRASFGFTKTIRFENFELALKSISLADHLEMAASFNAELFKAAQGNDPKAIDAYIAPRGLNTLRPYIESVTTYTDTGEVDGIARDADMIDFALDILTGRDGVEEKVFLPIMQFISGIQLTYVCYPTFACPKCGYEPTTPKGFYVVDPETVFFTIALKIFLDII